MHPHCRLSRCPIQRLRAIRTRVTDRAGRRRDRFSFPHRLCRASRSRGGFTGSGIGSTWPRSPRSRWSRFWGRRSRHRFSRRCIARCGSHLVCRLRRRVLGRIFPRTTRQRPEQKQKTAQSNCVFHRRYLSRRYGTRTSNLASQESPSTPVLDAQRLERAPL